MAFLEVRELAKSFVADQPILAGLNFTIGQGTIVCLLGASGSGKTTLLRMLAGLEQADDGTLRWEGQDLRDVPVHARQFGFMFQDHVLFPHKNVSDNIGYGLQMRRWPRPQIRARVAEMLALVRLEGYEGRRVQELSGGEVQRVALARSLAPSPRLLLLDEPLSSLDRNLRDELAAELRSILKALRITAIYVTHDQDEAFAVADQIMLLHAGQILRCATPEELHWHPGSVYAARFLRMHNILALAQGLPSWLRSAPAADPTEAPFLLIRPDALVMTSGYPEAIAIAARVTSMTFRGRLYEVELEVLDAQTPSVMLCLDVPLADADPELVTRLRTATGTRDIVPLALKPDRILALAA